MCVIVWLQESGEGAVKSTDNEPSGGKMEESISEEKVGHKFPEIHVDYYGPRGHQPKHH
jgi:hypothetical protein